MAALPSVCIIGAGSSGIAAAKALHERGIPFDCFEKSDRVGGNWVFGNKNGMSAAYRSLHINTSRERMEFSDFPMPAWYPDFPHHSHIASYFDLYVDHFGFRDRIAFETGVERAERGADGAWTVTLDTGEQRRYDALVVANGHHWDPRWPEPAYPGSFDGAQTHAHHYVDNKPFEGRRVLVVGIGNSAMDIAVESSFVSERTFLSARRGAYVLPKYIFGRPLDQIGVNRLTGAVPWAIRQRFLAAMYKVGVGNVEDYGLPKPDHGLGEAHPTISADFLNRLAHGEMAYKPGIASLAGERVLFEDGSEEEIDAIVWCTGYRVTFPFFDEGLISAPGNDLPLFRRVFHPAIDDVFFVGLLQPLGAIMPLSEAQGQWIAAYLRGEYALPDPAALAADVEAERRKMFKRYVASKRHTMQVDFDTYLHDLRRERKAGARRMRERGFALPVPARAGAEAPAS
ncbi:NAD(P)-binding domain-containing protein [Conexibacter sp. JD483]|uniref:flavin-containing monooxygenase n=1 Tax=unclassified Conexibacter TaxID=2627773 RepID=UPI002722B46B|nr:MULTISPECIES: NAD(P)-binding domain-containing protein [unclassified Conexibacter]MDO8188032.1 NAD(P)-binding domain-containing protein [Conexibacter sp. CPCC 205706]MDO8200454.1 NAD(P)-binding domain-containing protein [Conexibacter sp. CPCC 205762]MDR9369801.1 NAD(P)-binding domain-containing protein [Conexibacter sp. JD483]